MKPGLWISQLEVLNKCLLGRRGSDLGGLDNPPRTLLRPIAVGLDETKQWSAPWENIVTGCGGNESLPGLFAQTHWNDPSRHLGTWQSDCKEKRPYLHRTQYIAGLMLCSHNNLTFYQIFQNHSSQMLIQKILVYLKSSTYDMVVEQIIRIHI